jgi:O-antigen/teichoic acid export membrane protein
MAIKYLAGIIKLRPGYYLRSSGVLLFWLIIRALTQGLLILLIAKWLGSDKYGEFVSLAAISSFFVPLAGLGLHAVLLCDLPKNPEQKTELISDSLTIWRLSAIPSCILASAFAIYLLPSNISKAIIFIFCASEVIAASIIEISARIEQAFNNANGNGIIQSGLFIIRLLTLYPFIDTPPSQLSNFLLLYSSSSFFYAACIVTFIIYRHKAYPKQNKKNWQLIQKGLPFMTGSLSFRVQSEFNKPILAQASFSHSGLFNIAQRIIDIACLPLTALLETLWPKYYSNSISRKNLYITILAISGLSILIGLILAINARDIIKLLGTDFDGVIIIIQSLAGIPLLTVLRNFGMANLINKGNVSNLNFIYISTALINMALITALIPLYGLKGAVYSMYISETYAITMLYILSKTT